jgi:hypothetical protein
MDKIITKIISDVAEHNGVDFKTAELVYTDMFKFIRSKIEAINFDTIETEQDLRVTKVNFNIPRIFKMYTTINRINYARAAITKNSTESNEGDSIDDSDQGGEECI